MSTTEFIVILSTCANKTEAETIATRLVSERVAACVNITENVTSIYEWQGKIEKGTECLMVIKTRATLFAQVETTIKELSSYDSPEIIALPIEHGSPEYLKWIADATKID